MTTATANVYEISIPLDRDRETVVPYYTHAAEIFSQVQGDAPTRYTLYKYITEMPGYPVKRHGPYVQVPHFVSRKRVYTTVEAFERFIRVVAATEAELGIADIDITGLKKRPRARKAG